MLARLGNDWLQNSLCYIDTKSRTKVRRREQLITEEEK